MPIRPTTIIGQFSTQNGVRLFQQKPQFTLKNPAGQTKKRTFGSHPAKKNCVAGQNSSAFCQDCVHSWNSTWNVTKDDLRQVPKLYPLVRGTFVVWNVSVEDLAARIVNCLRQNSVFAQYDSSNASLEGETQSNVKFSLRIWFNSNSIHGGIGQGIIVEINRLDGCPIQYAKLRRCLVAAIKGQEEKPHSFGMKRKHITGAMHSYHENHQNHQRDIDSWLRAIVGMMKHADTREIGLRALCSLTDPKKADHDDSLDFAKAIVLGKNGIGNEARNLLFSNFLQRNTDDAAESIKGTTSRLWNNQAVQRNTDDAAESIKGTTSRRWNNQAAQILSHCLCQVLNSESLTTKFCNDQILVDTWKKLVPSLVDDLNRASIHPHDAYFSGMCLFALINLSEEAQTCAVESGIFPALWKAREFGESNYLALEQQSQDLLASLSPGA